MKFYMTSIFNTAKHGGGVLIAVRSDIYSNDEMLQLEAICIKIRIKENHTYIYCTHIPPQKVTISTYLLWVSSNVHQKFSQILALIRYTASEKLIMIRSATISKLYQIIYDTFEKFVPISSIRKSKKPKWYDKDLSHLKNVRNKRYKTLCKERRDSTICQPSTNEFNFINAKHEYESHRNHLFSEFLREQAEKAKNDPKTFWRHINNQRKSNSIPATMKYGDKTATTDTEKAQLFAEFFESVYVQHTYDSELSSFIENRRDHGCVDVFKTLSRMNLSKGSGHDGVSSIFLR